jgi:hypothetical protein
MAQRLKRWESPRKEGRNDKGKGGSARQRQLKKRTQMLRQKLKHQGNDSQDSQGQTKKGENHDSLPFFVPEHDENSSLLGVMNRPWVKSKIDKLNIVRCQRSRG